MFLLRPACLGAYLVSRATGCTQTTTLQPIGLFSLSAYLWLYLQRSSFLSYLGLVSSWNTPDFLALSVRPSCCKDGAPSLTQSDPLSWGEPITSLLNSWNWRLWSFPWVSQVNSICPLVLSYLLHKCVEWQKRVWSGDGYQMLRGTSLGGHPMQGCLWSKLCQVAVSSTHKGFFPADNLIKAKKHFAFLHWHISY